MQQKTSSDKEEVQNSSFSRYPKNPIIPDWKV